MSLKQRLGLEQEPLFIMDGSAFIYRGFYAYPDLKRSDGFPTNAIFIVLRTLLKIIKEENPKYFLFVRDGKGPTFRHELWNEYKAKRQKTPEDLILQLEPLDQALSLMGIKNIVSSGVEADDLLATLAKQHKSQLPVVIIGADKDLQQCLDSNVFIWDPAQRKEKLVSLQDFEQNQGLTPQQWPDFQALIGDSADNIPGVPKVGPKTAQKIMKNLPFLEDIKTGLNSLGPREQKLLSPYIEKIFLYRELTRLRTDCPLEFGLEDMAYSGPQLKEFKKFLQDYEFRSFLREINASQPKLQVGQKQGALPGLAPQEDNFELSSLPDLKGKEIAILKKNNEFIFVLQAGQFKAGKNINQFLPRLQDTKVYLFNFKNFLLQSQDWKNINYVDLELIAYLLNPEEKDYSWQRIQGAYQEQAGSNNILDIAPIMENHLEQAGLQGLLQDLEKPLSFVLANMEQRGIKIDRPQFNLFLQEVQKKLEELTKNIYAQAGLVFNIRSSQQLGEILFEHLKLKSKRKTSGGKLSTSSQVLESIKEQHPIVENILSYRMLEKLRSTYLAPLPQMVDAKGRLHSHFNQMATATGRLSSSHPNLQNIPIRGPMGSRVRACFVAEEGHVLVGADYSQIELRLLAHFSQDETLLTAFQLEEDIHTRTAAILKNKDAAQVLPEERRQAKTINFGLLYGMGPQKLGRELNISLKEAKDFIQVYFSRLQKVNKFYEQVEQKAKEQGYVTTLAGRRRLLPDINSLNQNQAQQARRMAINTVVQGSAADIIKMAMLAVEKDEQLQQMQARLILQVHDELLLEVSQDKGIEAGRRLAALMENIYRLSVPLKADWGWGQNWDQAH